MLFVCQRLWLFPLFDWKCPSRNGRLICYLSIIYLFIYFIFLPGFYYFVKNSYKWAFFFLQWIKKRWKTLKRHCNEAKIFLSVWCLFLLVVPWFRGWSATWVLPGRLRLNVINLDIELSLDCLLLVLLVDDVHAWYTLLRAPSLEWVWSHLYYSTTVVQREYNC